MIERLISNPVANWTVGILLTLALSSLAAAGMNTLLVARLLLIFAVGVLALVLFATPQGRSLNVGKRIGILFLGAAACWAIERWETFSQPPPKIEKPRRFPHPPLGLLLPPEPIFAIHRRSILEEAKVAVDYIAMPNGGFASFAPENEKDDVMMGIGGFDIQNRSDKPMKLSWSLHIKGEGYDFVLPGDGKGRWNRQLNKNDFFSQSGDGLLRWLLSPATLPPGKRLHGPLGFVVTAPDERVRELIISDEFDKRYEVTLDFHEQISDKRFSFQLPFGTKPVQDKVLLDRIRKSREGS